MIILTATVLDPRGWRVALRVSHTCLRRRPAGQCGQVVGGEDATVLPFILGCRFLAIRFAVGFRPGRSRITTVGSIRGSLRSRRLTRRLPRGWHSDWSFLYRRGWWLFPLFALLAGLQRCYAEAHFISDVMTGFGVGCLVAGICQAAEHG